MQDNNKKNAEQRLSENQDNDSRKTEMSQAKGHDHSVQRSTGTKKALLKPDPEVVTKIQDFIIFIYMAIAALFGFRFVLSLLGANQKSTFVSFVYDVTYPPLLPFDGMFGRDLFRPSGYTLEFEVLIALVVYAVVFYGFSRLVQILFD